MTARPALAKVQIARKELGLDDSTYRAMVARITGGKTSAKDCTDAELGLVIAEMRAKGWTPRAAARAAGKPRYARQADHPVAKKARAMWISLWQLGEVSDPSDSALEAFARRQLKVEQLQWADQGKGYKLIEALKAWAERAGWSQDLTGVDPANHVMTLKARLYLCLCARVLNDGEDATIEIDRLDDAIGMMAARLRARSAGQPRQEGRA